MYRGRDVLIPAAVPDNAPGLYLLALLGSPVSLALWLLALLLELGCVLLRCRGKVYAAVSILVCASVVALTAVFTLQPGEVLRLVLHG